MHPLIIMRLRQSPWMFGKPRMRSGFKITATVFHCLQTKRIDIFCDKAACFGTWSIRHQDVWQRTQAASLFLEASKLTVRHNFSVQQGRHTLLFKNSPSVTTDWSRSHPLTLAGRRPRPFSQLHAQFAHMFSRRQQRKCACFIAKLESNMHKSPMFIGPCIIVIVEE